MCGIAGSFDYEARRGDAVDELDRMVEVLRHRGPDDDGRYVDEHVALGMRRLSIIDVDGGAQPMSNEDGTVHVVCNGEIYNFRALRDALSRRGHRLVTGSDTEVVAHLYEDHGPALVEHLRGMFALAVWDASRRRLVLARDRLGIKPLYVMRRAGRLVFGSEIKSVLQTLPSLPTPDLDAVVRYLALKYVPSPSTMFAGIASLPPGCLMTVDRSGPRTTRYWDLDLRPERPERSLADATEELAGLLRESVRLHLQSDVPFGAFLSGGLDSSLVVGLMSEVLTAPVRTYSVGFSAAGRATGELPYAQTVATHFGTAHHELHVTGRDFVAAAERTIWHLDQPIADVAAVPMLLLSELARQDVKMVLSGEGGDELFAGYARYVGESLSPLLGPLPDRVRRGALRALRNRSSGRKRIALNALSQTDPTARLVNWFPLFDDDARERLLSPELAAAVDDGVAATTFAETTALGRPTDRLGQMLYCDTKLWLPDLLLARGDKVSMAASLELRVPLLDHLVVEFAAGLPSHLKLRRLTRKVVLREVAKPILPAVVLERRKEGFPVPGSEWLRDEAAELVADTLCPSAVRHRGLLDPDGVWGLVEQHRSRERDHGSQLWGLVALELWFRQFVDRLVSTTPVQRC